MAEQGHKIVYLIVERGSEGNRKTYRRALGAAYGCRDGSLNVKLDIHPNLTFNIREPKSAGEREETGFNNEAADEDDRVFPCDDCRIVTSNEDAHALSGGGAVCERCFKTKYKDCGRCGSAFPKVVSGTHCPACKGGGR